MKFLLILFLTAQIYCEEVVIRNIEGELLVVSVQPEDTFSGIIDNIQTQMGGETEYIVDFQMGDSKSKPKGGYRDYYRPITSKEKEDMSYIVNTLGMASLVKIAKDKSSLKKAGDRIANVHPFNFLKTIFTDEEMKVSVHAIQGRGWVRDDFFNGFKTSFDEEADRDNITNDMTIDFSTKMGIDPNLILPLVQERQWKQLINTLIDKIPRKTETDRYDM